jgi:iron complex transport system substrate-binding protein
MFLLNLHKLLIASGLAFSLAHPAFSADAFPLSIENCGSTVTLPAAPKRIFMVNTDDVALLAELDAVDLVVARTSDPVAGVYDEKTYAALAKVPLVATGTNATGGSVISLESIIATAPDLVLAPESAVDRQLLAAAGIALYSPPAYCNDTALIPGGTASFERVYDQVANFGRILGRSDLATERIAALKQQVAALGDAAAKHGTGFALYVSAGGKTLYPYGARSMVTPVFAAAGLENVYAGTDERVFEASTEDLLGKNPDVIVLLYSDGTPDNVLAAFAAVPGVENFAAVKNGRVIALPFPFTDPPTPLSVKGAVALAEKLAAKP